MHDLIAPGFFSSSEVQIAAAVGALVAVVAAGVGVFTVLRGQSFAGEALGDIGVAGGSGAFLAGVGSLWGFLASTLLGAAAIELAGARRRTERDLATGVVLGAGFGLSALLLYLATTYSNAAGAVVTVIFGSIFALSPSVLPAVLALTAASALTMLVLHRPLLLASVSPDLAAARGVRVRLVGVAYLLVLACTVALAALTVGAILATALLIGPAAAALRLARRPLTAVLAAACIGVACTWLGLLLSYDSYNWPPLHHGWPASFLIVSLILVAYLASTPLGRGR